MRRTFCILLSFIVILALLTGCTEKPESETKAPVEIPSIMPPQGNSDAAPPPDSGVEANGQTETHNPGQTGITPDGNGTNTQTEPEETEEILEDYTVQVTGNVGVGGN